MAQVYVEPRLFRMISQTTRLRKLSTFRAQDFHHNLRFVPGDIAKVLRNQPTERILNFSSQPIGATCRRRTKWSILRSLCG